MLTLWWGPKYTRQTLCNVNNSLKSYLVLSMVKCSHCMLSHHCRNGIDASSNLLAQFIEVLSSGSIHILVQHLPYRVLKPGECNSHANGSLHNQTYTSAKIFWITLHNSSEIKCHTWTTITLILSFTVFWYQSVIILSLLQKETACSSQFLTMFILTSHKWMQVTYCAFACEHWAAWVIHGIPNGPPTHVLLPKVPLGLEWLNQEAVNADVSYNYQLYSVLEPHCCLHIQEFINVRTVVKWKKGNCWSTDKKGIWKSIHRL